MASPPALPPPPPPPRRNRPSGPRKQGPRQPQQSIARSTVSPGPEGPRLVRTSPAPSQAPGQRGSRKCANPECPKSDIIEDENGGGLICQSCGMVLNESNIVSENQWIEGPGGTSGMAGQYVGDNQSAPRTVTGMRNKPGFGAGAETSDSKVQSEQRAKAEMEALREQLALQSFLVTQGLQIYKLAVGHGLLHGRTIQLVAAVSFYVACRRNAKQNTVMLMDLAEKLGLNVFVLGNLYTKMVEQLKGISSDFNRPIDPISPEALLSRFARDLEFGRDAGRITSDALIVFKRMKRDWMTDGRRPAGICGAAMVIAARMNNYRRSVREVVLAAKITEVTISKRLEEFGYTESSSWNVQQFRDLARKEAVGEDWTGGTAQSLPPAFYLAHMEKPKKKRGRPRKHPLKETAPRIEGATMDTRAIGQDAQPPRRDKDGFAIPAIPIDPRLQLSHPTNEDPIAFAQNADTAHANPPHFDVSSPSTILSSARSGQEETPAIQAEELGLHEETTQRSPSRSQTPQSQAGEKVGRQRSGRRKGGKNWKPPPPSAAELALEAEIDADVRYGLLAGGVTLEEETSPSTAVDLSPAPLPLSSLPPPPLPRPISTDLVPVNALNGLKLSKPGPAVNANVGNTGTVSLSPTISAAEFDDDPEVSGVLLNEDEMDIKERIWVADNADWLRKDHAKKILRELKEAQMRAEGIDPEAVKQKPKKRRPPMGSAPYMEGVNKRRRLATGEEGERRELTDAEIAQASEEATAAMLEARGGTTAFSRRFNRGVLDKVFGDGGGGEASPSRSRSHSVSTHISVRSASVETTRTTTSRTRPDDNQTRVFDEVGPLGPNFGRTHQSIAAEKREAKKRQERAERDTERAPQSARKTRGKAGESITAAQRQVAERLGAEVMAKIVTGASSSASRSPSAGANATSSPSPAAQLPTPMATQAMAQPRRPSADDVELAGKDEIVGSIGDSPLSSSMHSSMVNSPMIGAARQQGFGNYDDDDEDDDEDDEDEDEDEDDDNEDEMEDGEEDLDAAFAGKYKRRTNIFSDDEEEDDDDDDDGKGG